MTISPPSSINHAIVRTLRVGHGPKSLLDASGARALPTKWLHEGFAPEKTPYPFFTYQRFPTTPRVFTWGSVMLIARYDIKVYSQDSVEADNLDQLAAAVLDGSTPSVAGQSTLICRRVADLSDQDVDEEGQKIYMVGGTYEVWTDQPIPETRTASLTVDAEIV